MDVVCEVCGDVGYKYLLVQCKGCQSANRHRYCMDTIIYGGSSIEWFCDDCPPNHNNIVESLKERRDDHHSIQLGSSMIDDSNVKRVEVTKELWPWGRRRRRSNMARRYCTWGCRKPRSYKERRDNFDACAKCGDTFNSSEMYFEEKSKCNDVFKERESENDRLINQLENADGSSHSTSDFAAEIQKKPTMNTIEFLELSTEKDSCSFSLNCVEGSIHQGTKADFLPLINDVERSHPFVTDDSCPILPDAEQEDSSSHALGSAEQPHPLEMVDRDGNPDGSSHSPLDPALIEAGLFASVNVVEPYCPTFTDQASPTLSSEEQVHCSSPMSESWEQPHPLEVVKPYDDVPESILESEPASAHSQRMQVSDPHVGNMDVLDPSKECLDSRSMSKNVELPSSSDGDGNSAVEKDNAERTERLSGMETVSPALDNAQASRPSVEPSSFSNGGETAVKEHSERTECLTEPVAPAPDSVQGSSPSTTKGCLVSNVDNSNEANRSDNHLLCTIENKELGQLNALSYPNISSVEFQFSHNDLNESPHPTKHQKTKLIMKDGNAHPAHLKSSSPSKQPDRISLNASSELSSKAKEVNDGNDAEKKFSSSVPTSENIVPKKRKRHVESPAMNQGRSAENYDEALCPGKSTNQHVNDHTQAKKQRRANKDKNTHLENSSVPCTQNGGNDAEQRCSSSVPTSENIVPKKRKRHVESAAMNQRRSAENYDEALCPGKSTNQHVNDQMQAKKQRMANKDKNAHLENSSVPCTQNDAAQSASEAVVADGHSSLSRMPAVSAPTDQQHFICTQPIDRPYWTGIMKIGQEYISLAAHLSNQACQKVQELSRSLPPVMKVTEHSKLNAWPKRWEASEPTAESIGLFFFPDDMRPNEDLDRLVQHVTDHSIVLKYVFGSAELLILPSVFLPEQNQMFQGKHYLWGVFKRRMGCKAGSLVEQKVRASHTVEKKRAAAR